MPTKSLKDDEAWRNVLLYSEHTWGAHCSITKPDDPFTTEQWATKKAFADEADQESRALLAGGLAARGQVSTQSDAVDGFNTTQWLRTDLVTLPKEMKLAGEQVADAEGRPVPTQRLAAGELAFLATDVPAFGAKRYRLLPGPVKRVGNAKAAGNRLSTAPLSLEVDAVTGAIKSLRRSGVDADFVDGKAPVAINDFRYLLGTDAAGAKANGPATVAVLDAGPLVAALRITSEAPGCQQLVRPRGHRQAGAGAPAGRLFARRVGRDGQGERRRPGLHRPLVWRLRPGHGGISAVARARAEAAVAQ
jgi:hypothetical protein